jgi:hypothetical protein
MKAAVRLATELVEAYGEPLSVPNPIAGLTHVFPAPERVASANLTTLKMPFKAAQHLWVSAPTPDYSGLKLALSSARPSSIRDIGIPP